MHLSCGQRSSERASLCSRSHSWEVVDHEVKPVEAFLVVLSLRRSQGRGYGPFPQQANASSEACHIFLIIGKNKQSTVGLRYATVRGR